MTRINVINPKLLSNKHLVAEYREIMRLPNNLKKTLTRQKPFCFETEIAPDYILGPGHIKFFYNKFQFLKDRFKSLVEEMQYRGFTTNYTNSNIFNMPKKYMGNYIPTAHAKRINKQRIKERS